MNYDIYDHFTMDYFPFRQKMTLTTKIYCSRLYVFIISHLLPMRLQFNNIGTFIFYVFTVDGQIKLGHLKFNLCKSDY
jgi:hypothetical protein